MINAADVRVLVITPDASLASSFAQVSRDLGVFAQRSSETQSAPRELDREKYDAVLIDFDSIAIGAPIVEALRANPSNANAVVFAVATGENRERLALKQGANFVFSRPVETVQIRRILEASRDLMLQERRRYFRCSVELPVFLTRQDGGEVTCMTANVSAHGMSVRSSSSFRLGEKVGITLNLGREHVLAIGAVVWDDQHGKTGLSFRSLNPELQMRLDCWLDEQFAVMRRQSLQELALAPAR